MKMGKFLIVGGYGYVGRTISTVLANQFPSQVIAAGRNIQKAEKLSRETGGKVLPLALDVFDPDTDIEKALEGVSLVIMCPDQSDTSLVEQIVQRGIDYIDITATQDFLSAMEKFDGLAKESGSSVVLSVGLEPGLTNLLARVTRRRDALKNNNSIPEYVATFTESAVTDAQSVLDLTQQAIDAAQDGTTPYYQQIEITRSVWQLAQLNEAQAQARLDGLRSDSKVPNEAIDDAEATLNDTKDLVNATKSAYDELTSGASAKRLDSAWAEVEKAQAQLASVIGASGVSAEILLAQVDAATSQHHAAAANLSVLRNGAREEEIDAARAQVEAARAQLDAIDIQLKKLTITAPWDGVVLTRGAEVGGLALPGATLIEVGRLDRLELTVYLPEEQFGVVIPGQKVQVQVDAYPDRVFDGTVLRMADEAEFTPANVQTKEDRTRLVYAVIIRLDNPDLMLKPGMIADVGF